MLRFKEFRHKINEAGPSTGPLPGGDDSDTPEPEAPARPETPSPAQAPDNSAAVAKLKQEIDALVVQWVNELKRELVSGEMKTAPRGLWDRFKGGLANMWYGRYNQNNPYYWQNRLGDDLGRPIQSESTFNQLPFTLKEYMDLRNFFDEFEQEIKEDYEETGGTGGLRINQIINQKANELRQKLDSLILQHAQSGALKPSAPQGSAPSGRSSPRPTPARRQVNLPTGIDFKDATPDMTTTANDLIQQIQNADANDESSKTTIAQSVDDYFQTPNGKAWNNFGGGLVIDATGPCPDVPFIIRIGDPRIDYLRKFRLQYYQKLVRQQRIETQRNKITNANELTSAIQYAKGLPRTQIGS